jgi:hypothetical protein
MATHAHIACGRKPNVSFALGAPPVRGMSLFRSLELCREQKVLPANGYSVGITDLWVATCISGHYDKRHPLEEISLCQSSNNLKLTNDIGAIGRAGHAYQPHNIVNAEWV